MKQPDIFGKVGVTVTGSRDITDREWIFQRLNYFLSFWQLRPEDIYLNSGHARGVDKIAEDWGESIGLIRDETLFIYPAQWVVNGRKDMAAGKNRNIIMVDNCVYVCGLWNGFSTGTKHCIAYAESQYKHVSVYTYNKTI